MGIGLCLDIFFALYLTTVGKASPRCMTSQVAQTSLNVYSVALQQRPESEDFTVLGFRVGVANSTALVGLHLLEIMDLVGWKRSGAALPHFLLKEVVNPAGGAAKLADPRFDTGKGYKTF